MTPFSHCNPLFFSIPVADDVAYVWWYDKKGAIQSYGINFVQDLPYFLVLLLCFQCFTSEDWGIVSAFRPRDQHCGFLFPSSDNRSVSVTISENDKLHGHYRLVGRATKIFLALSKSPHPRKAGENLGGIELAVKVYWPEGSLTREMEIIDAAQQLGETYDEVNGHVPDLICSHDFGECSTATIRDSLGVKSEGHRILRVMLFRRLYPITGLTGEKFWKAFWDCFICELLHPFHCLVSNISQYQAITVFGLAV
jgi:Fungal protein kinase